MYVLHTNILCSQIAWVIEAGGGRTLSMFQLSHGRFYAKKPSINLALAERLTTEDNHESWPYHYQSIVFIPF